MGCFTTPARSNWIDRRGPAAYISDEKRDRLLAWMRLPTALADLVGRDVAIEPVPAQVVAGEQMPHPVRAGVGGAPATARLVGAAAAGGPLLAGVRLQVERPELVDGQPSGPAAGAGRRQQGGGFELNRRDRAWYRLPEQMRAVSSPGAG